MLSYHHPFVAREGWRLIAVVILLALVFHFWVSVILSVPFWSMAAFLCFLYRDPPRRVPPKPLAIVSPVDGQVTAINTILDPYIEKQVLQIQITMSSLNVCSARSPMEGKIIKQWFGKRTWVGSEKVKSLTTGTIGRDSCETVLAARSELKACRFAQWIQSDEHDDIVMTINPVMNLFRPRCYAHSGERIGQGQRCGIMPFGAVVTVSVPQNCRIGVKLGDSVRGGSDTLSTLVH